MSRPGGLDVVNTKLQQWWWTRNEKMQHTAMSQSSALLSVIQIILSTHYIFEIFVKMYVFHRVLKFLYVENLQLTFISELLTEAR